MKYASIKALVLLLGSGGLIAACASGTDSLDFSTGAGGDTTSTVASGNGGNGGSGNGGNGSTVGNGGSTGVGNPSSSAVTTTATTGGSQTDGGACIAKCYADYDCQNSCPVAQTGINCCDTATNLCYVDSNSVCPMPQNDGGVVTPPY